jgi:hypothetical protein
VNAVLDWKIDAFSRYLNLEQQLKIKLLIENNNSMVNKWSILKPVGQSGWQVDPVMRRRSAEGRTCDDLNPL